MLELGVISVNNRLVRQVPLVICGYVIGFIDFGICTDDVFLGELVVLVFEYLELAQCVDVGPLVGEFVFENAWCLAHW